MHNEKNSSFHSISFFFDIKFVLLFCVSLFPARFLMMNEKRGFSEYITTFFNIFSKREEDGWRKKSNACFHYPYLFRNEPSEYKNEIFVPTFLYFFFFSPLSTHHSHGESAAEAYTKISQPIHVVTRHVATRS